MQENGGPVDPGTMQQSSYDAFISYASADTAAARSVTASLERSGLSCWIAPRDVEPGTPYAESIIRAINSCRVMVVVLSESAISSTHVGKEIERASSKQRPIIALRTDSAPLTPSLEYFLSESQWIEVPEGNMDAVSGPLSKAVRHFAANRPSAGNQAHQEHFQTRHAAVGSATSTGPTAKTAASPAPNRTMFIAVAAAALIALGFIGFRMFGTSGATGSQFASPPVPPPQPAKPAASGSTPSFSPPPHSIAVLPFVNMSGDPAQDYFSDGLSEELLNSLTTIPALHVAARTSSFFFKGKNVDLDEIAHKLNVGSVLEGSVRKDGNQVRITAQLIDATSGFHIWSHTYDRNLKDVLKLQTDIATAVTQALQATLMADAASTIELGGTDNPKALDAYLRGKAKAQGKVDAEVAKAAIASYEEAIRLDPKFAKAYAAKSRAETGYAEYYAPESEAREHFNSARAAAERALELAPDLGLAHSAFGQLLETGFYDFRGSLAQHERALALAPNDSLVLMAAAWLFADIGRSNQAIELARRGVALDQLNSTVYRVQAIVMDQTGNYAGTIEATSRALELNPLDGRQRSVRGLAQLKLGDVEAARQSCEAAPKDWESHLCLAIAYHRLNRQADADAQLTQMHADLGDTSAYQYSEIMAQWGNIPKALDWIETAYRLRDPGLGSIKMDSFVDPLRQEPRFKEILKKLDIPD
jgi:TolB-like protein